MTALIGSPGTATSTTNTSSSTTTTAFPNTAAEFVAVVLAATVGARLFPMTSIHSSKHLLPMAGIPVVVRLLRCLEQAANFTECVLVIAQDDAVTVAAVLNEQDGGLRTVEQVASKPHLVVQSSSSSSSSSNGSSKSKNKLKITIVVLGDECPGSVEALRQVEAASVIPASSHVVVFPGDLVVFDADAIRKLVDTHRQGKNAGAGAACTMLLADVGEEDEHGAPLKESSKQKKGGLAREEQEIEYIALTYASSASFGATRTATTTTTTTATTSPAPRVVWKQSKLDVEADEDMVGSTPKLVLPKPRLRHGGVTRVRTEWSDLHVYALAPWVRRLLLSRKNLLSIQGDLVPLLIARQFHGVVDAFGSQADKELLDDVLRADPTLGTLGGRTEISDDTTTTTSACRESLAPDATATATATQTNPEFTVLAHVVEESALRASTIASYLYASKDVVTRAVHATTRNDPCLFLPEGTSVKPKFTSLLLPETDVEHKKITFKSCAVGRRCQLGDKCRLNNVIIMDNVIVGENVILQNTIIGAGCKIGDNCNLNDCQVSPGKTIPSGTKEKGESFI